MGDSTLSILLLLTVLSPLAGAIVSGAFGSKLPRTAISAVAVGSITLSFVFAAIAYAAIGAGEALVYEGYRWITIPLSGGREVPIEFALRMDALSGMMTVMVTGIAALIHLFSTGYMSEERSYARYFAHLNFFTFSMLILVLASNLPLLFVGWEGVGLASYLLIGFWHSNLAYEAAARKAFIMNRIGDLAVLVAIFIIVQTAGTLDFTEINASVALFDAAAIDGLSMTKATLLALLLFWGCTAKSAQIPLFTWLPDAMAGPTPVSALIHAATMVTSGVYLAARMSPVFVSSSTALTVILLVGALTALVAGLVAVSQNQMKKVLAFSTVSQLGFMFAAIGVGAFSAALFHVLTHAFFKALLFLGSGAVMYAVGADGDAHLDQLGGLRKKLTVTAISFLIGVVALAGIPLTAGFFSKDQILHAVFGVASGEALAAGDRAIEIPGWAGVAALTMLLIAAIATAFYAFKLYLRTFEGEPRSQVEPKAVGRSMTLPLVVLAVGSIAAGYLWLPVEGMEYFAESLRASVLDALPVEGGGGMLAMILGTAAALLGLGIAFGMYRGATEDPLPNKLGKANELLMANLGIDTLYRRVFIAPFGAISRFVRSFDRETVDALFVAIPALVARGGAWAVTRLQSGVVHAQGTLIAVGVLLLFGFYFYPRLSYEVIHEGGSSAILLPESYGTRYRVDLDGDGRYELGAEGFESGPQRIQIANAHAVEGEYRLLIYPADRGADEPIEIALSGSPTMLTERQLGSHYLPKGARGSRPVVVYQSEEGVRIRTNLPDEDGERTLLPGRQTLIGTTRLYLAPLARVRIEAENAFGHVTTETAEIALRGRSAGSRRVIPLPSAGGAR